LNGPKVHKNNQKHARRLNSKFKSLCQLQVCHCAQCLAHPRISASAPTSRRSSYGSHFNVNKDTSSPSHNNNNTNGGGGGGGNSGSNNGGAVSVSSTDNESKLATPNASPCNEAESPGEGIEIKVTAQDGEDEAKVFNRVIC
jgi:hypothetical protein